jgi:hypothetical protein
VVDINEHLSQGDLIQIDTKKFQLSFYHKGEEKKIYPVAIGKDKTPTPVGEWKVVHKGENWGDGFGVRWLGLNVPFGIYGIHGTDQPESIGTKASHGCIRMSNEHVLKLYDLTQLRTPVHILGDLPRVKLRKVLTRNLTGQDVLVLQFALRKAGFDPGAADGRFGPKTEQAIFKFQNACGLESTGRITLKELHLLGLA